MIFNGIYRNLEHIIQEMFYATCVCTIGSESENDQNLWVNFKKKNVYINQCI